MNPICPPPRFLREGELADDLAKFGQAYVVNKLAENSATQSSLLMRGCVNSRALFTILLNSCMQESNLAKLANEIPPFGKQYVSRKRLNLTASRLFIFEVTMLSVSMQ